MLGTQFYDSDGFAAALFGFEGLALDEGMSGEKLSESLAEGTGTVAVNDADTREMGESGIV